MTETKETTASAVEAGSGLRARKKIRSYRTIQDAGVRLFEEQGLAGTTVEQIADEAGVSPRTVYRYFRTKEGVLFSTWALREIPARFVEQPRELGPLGALERAINWQDGELAQPSDDKRRALRLSLMGVPAVSRYAAEAAESLAVQMRHAALVWLGNDPNAAAIADILAALLRMMVRSHFDGVPLTKAPLRPWLEAMRTILDTPGFP